MKNAGNGDGEMTYDEGISGGIDPFALQIFFKTHDKDNSSTANTEELAYFLWFFNNVKSRNATRIACSLWNYLGGDGHVTVDEMVDLGVWSRRQVEEFFEKADKDSSGKVTFEELAKQLGVPKRQYEALKKQNNLGSDNST